MRQLSLIGLLCLLLGQPCPAGPATATNSLVWLREPDRISADLHGVALWPLLEDIGRQTGWRIFVEPGVDRQADVRFSRLPEGEALKKLLGDLNFALVPKTNESSQLYVFATTLRAATQSVSAASTNAATGPKHVRNELILKVKPGTDIDALAKSLGARVIGRDDRLGIYRLQFDTDSATESALGQLKSNASVETAEYNFVFDPPAMPQAIANAPVGPVSLTLDPTSANDPCHPIVGVIDTRIQSLGSQLDPFVLKALSVAGDPGAMPGNDPTHGTAMVETVLRAISQQGGRSSIRILPVDVYGASESTTSWNVALGIQKAWDNGATVFNLSLGSVGDSVVLNSVIQQVQAKGGVVFAAAGNQPVTSQTFPAATPGVIAVTALGQPGQLASYANRGSFVSLALPGASVVYLGSQAYVVQGTSAATAYASGVAAGYKGVNCDGWPQIQKLMQAKFPVPAK